MFEENARSAFVLEHPSFDFAKSCSELAPPKKFRSISSYYPDLVCRLHVQIRLMGNFGLNTSIPWAKTTDSTICFICKEGEETLHHFPGIIFFLIVRVFGSILTYFGQSCQLKLYAATRRMVTICLTSL